MRKRIRAVIIKDENVLTVKRTKPEIEYWVIPGGGVKEGEENELALRREAREELGVDIEIEKFLFKIISQKDETFGHEEYFYACKIIGGELGSGQGPEFSNPRYIGTHTIEWLEIKNLKNYNLQPVDIKNFLENIFIQKDVKFWIGKKVKVKIDRQLGSKHPNFKTIYPINYGFIPGTFSEADGEEIDAYVLGVEKSIEKFSGKVVAVIKREDDEIKLVVTAGENYSEDEIKKATYFQEKYFKSKIYK